MKKMDKSLMEKIFSTKANTLDLLQNELKFSSIENLYYFSVNDWKECPEKIFTYIKKFFRKKIVIRSSAFDEDSINSSFAGVYSSILNVSSQSKKDVYKAINSVIESYFKNKNYDLSNQILVQNHSSNIAISGVIFTRTLEKGSPYYVINFEKGSSTTGVTHGVENNSVRIFRLLDDSKIPSEWKSLIAATKEIESFFKNTSLDIEFALTKNDKVIIFQVRPLTSIKSISFSDYQIKKLVEKNKKQFLKLFFSKNIIGNYTIFSDMSDWNPSEIIGDNPHPLDYSLYDYLIMKKAWRKGREIIGYQKTNSALMTKFGNKPYVNILASINSLIPENISKKLKIKLINYYLEQIKKDPSLHDKIEFEILFTSYDYNIDSNLKKLKNFKFTNSEIEEFNDQLLIFTNKLISDCPKLKLKNKNSINQLSDTRISIVSKMKKNKKSNQNLLKYTFELLNNCIACGTIPFSTIARIAFISNVLLKTLLIRSNLDSKNYDLFLNSLSTPLSEIQQDLISYSKGKLTKKQFLSKFGHLRPGTYDITAIRYDMKNDFFKELKINEIKHKSIKKILTNPKLNQIINSSKLNFDAESFFIFVKDSIEQREFIKFEFTKNLSLALEIIAQIGKNLGFTRHELSFLEINDLFKKYSSDRIMKSQWKLKIESNRKKFDKNNLLIFPSIISDINDLEYIKYFESKPNFISNKKIRNQIIKLNQNSFKENLSLKNKIVLIENADPGFDWIFTRNPAGLITKYGGVASHMSIRCGELGLPAAIGCGEILFEQLTNASTILLDCLENKILILENKIIDDEIEVKKVLRSLGYIR